MSKVRIITPIVTKGFRGVAALQGLVGADCDLSSVFLENGPASVESAVDEVLAGPGVVDAALRAEADGVQAIVIDCMLDPALEAAREAVGIPVVGCGEASLGAAAAAGAFSIVTVLQRQERAFRALSARYGIGNSLRSVRGIGISVLGLEREPEAAIAATIREARAAAEQDGARAIVFGCTGMLGFGAPVSQALGTSADKVIDPLPFAVAEAHAAVVSGMTTDKILFPMPEPKAIQGFASWPALNDLMAARE